MTFLLNIHVRIINYKTEARITSFLTELEELYHFVFK